jgi:DNA repair photolyase
VRWDELKVEQDAAARLPGYRDEAVVRRFSAPEAMDVRFYEVKAKSVLNRVPKASRVPFPWTINPYRGCTHACVYCLAGDTRILLADGRTRALQDLRVGDAVYGTEQRGASRRLVRTEVRAHWSSVKPALRVTLEDGTELVASGDHRFLTTRGWKHVTEAPRGAGQRPHLTPRSRLMGTGGAFPEPPQETSDYRRGYLCGLVRGDGLLGTSADDRPGRGLGEVHRLRLALADGEALQRAQAYLDALDITARELPFAGAGAGRREMRALRTSARDDVFRELVTWPLSPSDDWRRGFLAGIFDAEGSWSQGILRISSTDAAMVGWTSACLAHFGFDAVIEPVRRDNGLQVVRVRGGLEEHLRLLHLSDPAITRKRDLDGRALKTDARLGVVSVEPLGLALRLFDITTGTGDFIANGVVSHNCFARPTHTYLDFDAGRDFEREIVVKVNTPEVVRAELSRRSWRREHVAMGTNTDPYQWVESRYRLMPGIWEALRDTRTPCSVLTKSPLLLRDLALLREVGEVTTVAANLSIPTWDEKVWRATEPHTPHPRARMEAVAELNRAGIPCGILVAPLMPGVNDAPEQVEPILQAAAEAGATGVGGIGLHLRGEVRGLFFAWLEAMRPDLVERYRALYRRGAYLPAAEQERLQALLRESPAPWRAPLRSRGVAPARVEPAPPAREPEPVQAALF